MLVADAFDHTLRRLNVEEARCSHRNAPSVSTRFLARGNIRLDDISRGKSSDAFFAQQIV